jgi:peptide/nickel transport system substrate-binding protein
MARVGKDKLGLPENFGRMGTGPWKVESYDPTRGAELVANDSYWGGRPQIRRISIKPFLSMTSEALAFRAGEIDVGLGVTDGRSWEATTGTKLERTTRCMGTGSRLQLQSGAGPTSDVHVRRAIAYALNHDDLITAAGGFAKPYYSIITPETFYTLAPKKDVDAMLKRLPQYRYSLAKARQEMAQSAYPNGFKMELGIWPGNVPVAVSQALGPMLKPIGIDVQLTTGGNFFAELVGPPNGRPNYFDNAACNNPDPGRLNFLYDMKKDGTAQRFNFGNYTNSALPGLVEGTQTAPRAKRLAAFEKLYTRVMNDVPYIPIWKPEQPFAISNRFTWPTYDFLSYARPWALEIKPK